jgi:hypothetical protein
MSSAIPFKRYVLVLLATLLMQTPLAHAALIGLQPEDTLATNGDSISFDLVISDLGAFSPDSLGAFDLFIGFDAAVLSFTGYSLGDFLGDISLFEAIDASPGESGGVVNLAEVSLLSAAVLDALQPGEFILATLNFTVNNLGAGAETLLSFMGPNNVLADGNGVELLGNTFSGASVQGIPVPGTLFLLAAALVGGLALKRRQSV